MFIKITSLSHTLTLPIIRSMRLLMRRNSALDHTAVITLEESVMRIDLEQILRGILKACGEISKKLHAWFDYERLIHHEIICCSCIAVSVKQANNHAWTILYDSVLIPQDVAKQFYYEGYQTHWFGKADYQGLNSSNSLTQSGAHRGSGLVLDGYL